jgi:hypothetical protein
MGFAGPELGLTTTAEGAVSLAVGHVPAYLNAVSFGAETSGPPS